MKKTLLLFGLAFLSVNQVRAQTCIYQSRFGVLLQLGGGTLFNQVNNSSLKYTYTPGVSFAVGGYYNVLFAKHFGVEPAITMRSMYWKEKKSIGNLFDEYPVRGNYISAPLNFQLFINPSFRFNIGPEAAYLFNIKSTELNSTTENNTFDFSANVGFDYRVGGYRFGLNYNRGFTNFYNNATKTGKNTGLFLTFRLEY